MLNITFRWVTEKLSLRLQLLANFNCSLIAICHWLTTGTEPSNVSSIQLLTTRESCRGRKSPMRLREKLLAFIMKCWVPVLTIASSPAALLVHLCTLCFPLLLACRYIVYIIVKLTWDTMMLSRFRSDVVHSSKSLNDDNWKSSDDSTNLIISWSLISAVSGGTETFSILCDASKSIPFAHHSFAFSTRSISSRAFNNVSPRLLSFSMNNFVMR